MKMERIRHKDKERRKVIGKGVTMEGIESKSRRNNGRGGEDRVVRRREMTEMEINEAVAQSSLGQRQRLRGFVRDSHAAVIE